MILNYFTIVSFCPFVKATTTLHLKYQKKILNTHFFVAY